MQDIKRAHVLFMDGKYAEAAAIYREGAEEGDLECAFNYGYCLYHGYGVMQSREEAKSFFVFASRLDGGDACYNLAVMYLFGFGVKQNYKKTYEYMYDAARLGSIEAQLYLGVAHTLGSLFDPDVKFISRIPFHKSEYSADVAELDGYVPDMTDDEEARMSALRFDPVSAFEWFREAAKQNNLYAEELSKTAKYLYARCYLDGLGTDFNLKRGNELMLIAASEGSSDALTYLETSAPYVLENLKNGDMLDFLKRKEGIGSPKESN